MYFFKTFGNVLFSALWLLLIQSKIGEGSDDVIQISVRYIDVSGDHGIIPILAKLSYTFWDICQRVAEIKEIDKKEKKYYEIYKENEAAPRMLMLPGETLKSKYVKTGDTFLIIRLISLDFNPAAICIMSESEELRQAVELSKQPPPAIAPDVRPPDEPYQETLLPGPQLRHSNGISISLAELEEDAQVRELYNQMLRNVVSPTADNPQVASKESEQSPGHHSRTRQSAPPCLRRESAASSKSNAIFQPITSLVFSMVVCFF